MRHNHLAFEPPYFSAMNQQSSNPLPTLNNASLAEYVGRLAVLYPNAEFYKEELRDTGRGEGPSLLITVCQDGSIIEEENFYYPDNADISLDLEKLDAYLDFD
jgi:hypothetical protein